MRSVNSLNHTRWECKYHIVFIPKYGRKVLFGEIGRDLGEIFHRLARQKESLIEEGHLMQDHVHMMISIPPKYPVAQVIGYIKGKSAIHIARNYSGLYGPCQNETCARLSAICSIQVSIRFLPDATDYFVGVP